MRYQVGRGFEMHRMGMESVAAVGANRCWNEEKESSGERLGGELTGRVNHVVM